MASPDTSFGRRRAALALVLLSVPYLALYVLGTGRGTYTGVLFNPSDTFLYLTQVRHGHQGQLGFINYFTHHLEPSLPIYTLYSLVGLVTPLPMSVLTEGLAFHLARLAICALFMWQLWRLLGDLAPHRAVRRVAYLFVAFSAGAGVLQLLLPLPRTEPPYDLFITESSTYAGLVFAPHFAAVLLLLVIYLRALWRVGTRPGTGWPAVLAGAASAAAISTIHPDKVVVLALTTVLFIGYQWGTGAARSRRWTMAAQALLMLAGGLPYFAYSFYIVLADPQIAHLLRQGLNHEFVPDPLPYYVFGFGIPGLLALCGLPGFIRGFRQGRPAEALLWAFALAGLVLLVTPYRNVGHRGEGLHLAIAILGARQLVRGVLPRAWRTSFFKAISRPGRRRYGRRRLRVLTLNLVLIFSSTSVLALAFATIRAGLAVSSQVYVGQSDRDALRWLAANARAEDVVVGDPYSTQFVAAYAGTHVTFGQQAYTPDYDLELASLSRFFRGVDPPLAYLTSHNARWLYFGPRERADAGFDPRTLTFLEAAYQAGDVTIYRVARGPLTADAESVLPPTR